MDQKEKQIKHFESISKQYYSSRQTPNHLLLKQLLWSYFFSNSKLTIKKEKLKILEPMCGYGEGGKILSTYLASEIRYTGFDSSSTLVDRAKELSNFGLKGEIFQGDVTSFESKEEYDGIILIGGLHHVYRYSERVIQNLYKSLAENGFCINFEPTSNCFINREIRSFIYGKNSFFDEENESGFELEDYNRLFEQTGFRLKKQIYPGLLAYILWYNPDAFPFLNIGGPGLVRTLFSLEKHLYKRFIGKKLSFCTLSLWIKDNKEMTPEHKIVYSETNE